MADEVGVDREKFKKLFSHATNTGNKHDFLNIDSDREAEPVFRKSFGTYLHLDDDPGNVRAMPTDSKIRSKASAQ